MGPRVSGGGCQKRAGAGAVRHRSRGELGTFPLEEFVVRVLDEVRQRR
ncbi:MAG: hypothetical protein K6U07_10105 [Firmicutes bacterium]|nr:hypothetical protein [Bacillota bacterium]